MWRALKSLHRSHHARHEIEEEARRRLCLPRRAVLGPRGSLRPPEASGPGGPVSPLSPLAPFTPHPLRAKAKSMAQTKMINRFSLALLWQIIDFEAFYRIPESIFQ